MDHLNAEIESESFILHNFDNEPSLVTLSKLAKN